MTSPASGACPYSGIGNRFDPFDGEPTRMYPLLAEARQSEPVFYSPVIDYWVVTRYDDVREVMGGDPEVYSASAALELIAPLCPAAIDIAVRHGIVLQTS